AAADRARALVAGGRQPLAIRTHLLARVHRRQRRGDPSGLEGVARVGTRSHLLEAEVSAGLHDGSADLVVLGVGTPDLESRLPRHSVAQTSDLPTFDVDDAHVEELDLRQRSAVELRQNLRGVRTLDLESVVAAVHGLTARIRGGSVITDHLDP